MNHAPTPWMLDNRNKSYVGDSKGNRLLTAVNYDVDDAAFIVRAVNAYEELLAMLKEAREFVAFATTKLKYQSAGNEFEPNRESAEGTLGRMEQAIAKAEGK